MKIRMTDGTVVDNVRVCEVNSLNYALTIVVDCVDITGMAELTSLFGDKDKTHTLTKCMDEGVEKTFVGYSNLTGVGFDAITRALTLFLADR